ncbi:flagellar biosynthesis protein FlgA [Micromonospora sp. NPDC048839]|uniref:flagellar biosynthesis protein FlgA n=1 Tax=Micromonospora sp. NPDC048839 TaxID=3155641 RepID=UPI003400AEAE
MGDPDSARALRPLRRPALPGGPVLLRAGLVAALLGLAAAVLHTPTGCPPPAAPTEGPTGTAATSRGGTTTDSGTAGPLPLPNGAVGVPVRLAEPAALAVARPGVRVDLLAVPPGGVGTAAALLAPAALVLDVLGADPTDRSPTLYLALRPDQAQRTAGLPEGTRFAIVVHD